MVDWNRIPFGKYDQCFFDEVNDYKYLCWFIGKLNNECQIRYCAKAIIKAINKKRGEKWEIS